jgi:hypothetical protein
MKLPILKRLLAAGAALCAFALPASAGTYHITGGTTMIWLDQDAVNDAGLSGPYVGGSLNTGVLTFDVSSSTFGFDSTDYTVWGSLNHSGSATFTDAWGSHTVGNLMIGYDAARGVGGLSGLYVADTLGDYGILFDIAEFDIAWWHNNMIWTTPTSLYLAPEIATYVSGNWDGRVVGAISFAGTVRAGNGNGGGASPVPDEAGFAVTAMMAGVLLVAGRYRRRQQAA